jgi:tetratricopeptide (TPR) repeat protein
VKRAFGIVVLVALAVGILYGVAIRQREASYARFVDQGDAALARDDSFAAIEAFSVAISLKGDSMAGYLKRGEAYRRRGEYDAAARDLRRAAAIDPLAIHPRELLGDIEYAMALADGASAQMRFSRAIARYRESVALDDRSARLQYKLGLASCRAGQIGSALTALREAIRLDPRFAEAHYVLGMCLRKAGQDAEAVRALERAVTLAPALLAAREELADLYASLRRFDARLPHVEALVALQPGAARERALAFAYARAGNPDRAVGQLASAAQRYPEDRATYVALGRLWLQRAGAGGRVEVNKALQALNAVVGGESTSEALTLLGRALILSGDLARAEQTLQQATARFPVEPSAFLYLSRLLDRQGRTAAAQRAVLDYAALVPADTLEPSLLARVADAQLQLGDHEAARRTVAIALAKDPSNATAHALRSRLQ